MENAIGDRLLNVKKDPLDLRDLLYEPTLAELPFEIKPKHRGLKILDQGKEGACTGFGLAAVANYLLSNRSDRPRLATSVSPRMLYEMAQRYDEWEGEHYEGSSIRGAMKGWHKHGVCSNDDWEYSADDPGRLTPERQKAALKNRLGAYFRVRHLHLNHMQNALSEVGIIYASAAVHEGWNDVNARTGKIPFRRDTLGGHAFAIVGYDEDGFWIQNSWGKDWGKGGLGHLSYADWLENGRDCWAARLGVPTTTGIPQESRIGGRAAEFNLIPQEAALLHDIDLHFVNLGNEGEFSRSGHYRSSEDSVDRLIADGLKPTIRKWGGTRKLLLYAHGGLSSEVTAAVGISRLLPHFMENGIYPMFFMWETGLVDSVRGIIEDAFRRRPFLGWRDDLKDRFLDMLDESIELAARSFGLPIWNQMKGNARGASVADAEPERGATYLAGRLVEYASEEGPLEIHLLGHSAGAIFHAHLLRRLTDLRMKVKTMTLLAPACTVELFDTHIWPHVANNDLQRLTVLNLTDEFERDDSAGPVYNKSLLYLVSESFEPRPGTPILGMNKFVTGDRKLKEKLGQPISGGSSTVIYSVGGPRLRLRSGSTKHSSFDADRATLNSALSIILGKRPKKPF